MQESQGEMHNAYEMAGDGGGCPNVVHNMIAEAGVRSQMTNSLAG